MSKTEKPMANVTHLAASNVTYGITEMG